MTSMNRITNTLKEDIKLKNNLLFDLDMKIQTRLSHLIKIRGQKSTRDRVEIEINTT